MSLTNYLKKEASYFPWDSAINALSYVTIALQRTQAYGDFKVVKYAREYEPKYDDLNHLPK